MGTTLVATLQRKADIGPEGLGLITDNEAVGVEPAPTCFPSIITRGRQTISAV